MQNKVKFNREQLLKTLKKAIAFVPKKPVITACEDFLFAISGNLCKVTATDIEKQITVSCIADDHDGDIMFTIPARIIVSALGLMLDDEVVFALKDPTATAPAIVELKCGKSKYKLNSSNGLNYPLMQPITPEFEASFTGSAFNKAIEISKKYTDSKDTNTQWKGGVCMRMKDNKINFYSTSGFEISRVAVEPRSIHQWEDAVIPIDAVSSLEKCVADSAIVDVMHNKEKIEIKAEGVSILARLFVIKFPDCEKLFSIPRSANIKLNTVQATMALQRLALVSNVVESDHKCVFDIQSNSLVISVDNTAYNRHGDEQIDIEASKEVRIGISFAFVLSALSCITSDEFTITYEDEKISVLIEPFNVVGDNMVSLLIAPMNI